MIIENKKLREKTYLLFNFLMESQNNPEIKDSKNSN